MKKAEIGKGGKQGEVGIAGHVGEAEARVGVHSQEGCPKPSEQVSDQLDWDVAVEQPGVGQHGQGLSRAEWGAEYNGVEEDEHCWGNSPEDWSTMSIHLVPTLHHLESIERLENLEVSLDCAEDKCCDGAGEDNPPGVPCMLRRAGCQAQKSNRQLRCQEHKAANDPDDSVCHVVGGVSQVDQHCDEAS